MIQTAISTHEILERVTLEMIEDHALDNVQYLEIRSGPRSLDGKPAGEYIETLLRAIETAKTKFPQIRVKLLVSISRDKPMAQANERLALALKYKDRGVVGLDLSGRKGLRFGDLKTHFERATAAGLSNSIHIGEWKDDEEIDDILDNPHQVDRVGHAVCMTPEQFDRLRQSKIGIELC